LGKGRWESARAAECRFGVANARRATIAAEFPSLGGPALAKKIHYVDPLDVRETDIKDSKSAFDLKF
jgi:hypothetical protein